VVTGQSARTSIGARVTLFAVETQRIVGHDAVRTDFCYRSKRSPLLHFGLGPQTAVNVLVKTRCGPRRWFKNLEADRTHTLDLDEK
jgi:hypothetical protein